MRLFRWIMDIYTHTMDYHMNSSLNDDFYMYWFGRIEEYIWYTTFFVCGRREREGKRKRGSLDMYVGKCMD